MSKSALLRDLLLYTRDGEWGQGELGEGLIPMKVIRGADFEAVRSGDLTRVPIRFIPEAIAERKALIPDDVLIETAGGGKDRPTGRTILVKESLLQRSELPLICASFARFLRSDPDQIHGPYLFWYLQYLYFNKRMAEHQVQHTGISRFQYTRFAESISVPTPPLREQRAIAHILGALDDKIELNRRMNHTLEEMARALFKSWFVDFDPVRAKAEGRRPVGMDADTAALFPDSFEDSELGAIPKGWGIDRIGKVITAVGGSTPSTKIKEYWEEGTINWTTPKDLSGLKSPVLLNTAKKITSSGLKQISSGLLPSGTVLLSSRAPIGYLAITQIPLAINQGYIAIPPGGSPGQYFMLLWLAFNMDRVKQHAGGTTFQEISKTNFREILIGLPDVEIVRSFEKRVQSIYDLIVLNESASRTLTSLRDTLLPRLISGELRVKDAEREVQAVV